MCDDCSESTSTSDISCDTSSDTTCDMPTDTSADITSELPEDTGDLSDDESDDLPENDCFDVEDAAGDMQVSGEMNLLDRNENLGDESSDSGICDLSADSSYDMLNESADTIYEDGSEDLPDGIYDSKIFDESGNLKVMNNEEYLSLTSEQQKLFDEKFYGLSKEEQERYNTEFACADLESYIKHVENGDYKRNEAVERDITDIINGKYSGETDEFDSTITKLCAEGAISSVGASLGLDPLTKTDLTNQAGEIGRIYGPHAMENIARTAHIQNGTNIPTPIIHEDECGNKIYDYGQVLDNQEDLKLSDNDIAKYKVQNITNSEEIDSMPNKLSKQSVLKAGANFEGSGRSAFDLQNSKAGQIKLPKNGDWSGKLGDSYFCPQDKERLDILKKYGTDSIKYNDNAPDFSPFKVDEFSEVKISDFGDNRFKNFSAADKAYAEQKGCTSAEARQFRKDNTLTWHEADSAGNMILVPQEVHEKFAHSGGVSEVKGMQVERAKQAVDGYRNLKLAKPINLNLKRLK